MVNIIPIAAHLEGGAYDGEDVAAGIGLILRQLCRTASELYPADLTPEELLRVEAVSEKVDGIIEQLQAISFQLLAANLDAKRAGNL